MSNPVSSKPAEIVTFGCRLNSFESEVMKDEAAKAGLDDNTIIFNTCAVTAEAERQARQAIRKARREKPTAQIVVTGCGAQINAKAYGDMPEVNTVLGNQEKLNLSRHLGFGVNDDEAVRVNDIFEVTEIAPHMIAGFGERARAHVQVQNGCDHRCTFCIIPFGRGNSRSVPMGQVVEQIKKLTQEGYKEVVLTGVDLTSYGPDLPGTPSLGALVQRILKQVPDLPRLRLSSIDSIEVDTALMDAITGDSRVMPYLHLSLQSGDDMILKRMKRRHSRDEAIAFCAEVKAKRPAVTFGADIIAGFPTESEEMFENSLKLVDECGLTFLHVFPYSPREGTPAARMPQLDRALIKDRARRLRQKGGEALASHLAAQQGRVVCGLVERAGRARAEDFTDLSIPTDLPSGTLHKLRVTGQEADYLTAVPA